MSKFDYERSRVIAAQGEPFYAQVMALMRRADGPNLDLLKAAFPATYDELLDRYNAPGGVLPGEVA